MSNYSAADHHPAEYDHITDYLHESWPDERPDPDEYRDER